MRFSAYWLVTTDVLSLYQLNLCFANFGPYCVTLWPWPLTPWSWIYIVDGARCFESIFQISLRSLQPRLSYWRLTTDFLSIFRGCSNTAGTVSETRGPICTKFSGDIQTLSDHVRTPSLKMVKMSCSVSKAQQLKVDCWWAITPKIALFDPCKN